MSNARMRTENAAQLGALLNGRLTIGATVNLYPADAVLALQKAARILHRNSERACNEDCGCPKCQGQGDTMRADGGGRQDCPACAGTGQTFGKREARLMERVRAIGADYRLRVYEQGDPRGWPLYLIPEESGPKSEDGSWYSSRGFAVCPH